MIACISSAPYARTGAVISALIIICCAVGLTLDSDFYAGVRRRDFYAYYTNQSNLLVLLYFAFAAPLLYSSESMLITHAEFALTMSILLTFAVFHFILRPFVLKRLRAMSMNREDRMKIISNVLLHYAVPLMTALYWLLCSPGKAALGPQDALLWTAFPLLYLLFTILRARLRGNICGTDCPYPYPFLNVQRFGWRRVISNCAVLYAGVCLFSLLVIRLTQLAFIRWGDGHAYFLI